MYLASYVRSKQASKEGRKEGREHVIVLWSGERECQADPIV